MSTACSCICRKMASRDLTQAVRLIALFSPRSRVGKSTRSDCRVLVRAGLQRVMARAWVHALLCISAQRCLSTRPPLPIPADLPTNTPALHIVSNGDERHKHVLENAPHRDAETPTLTRGTQNRSQEPPNRRLNTEAISSSPHASGKSPLKIVLKEWRACGALDERQVAEAQWHFPKVIGAKSASGTFAGEVPNAWMRVNASMLPRTIQGRLPRL